MIMLKSTHDKILGFILTMWYVNSTESGIKKILLNMFYINYVVCKFNWSSLNSTLAFLFYINYVVCKSGMSRPTVLNASSFILTMWYVN